jgi:threonine/homoserine/homoserine lactone efflux protein
MMLETWLGFIAVSAVMLAIPGPTILWVLQRVLAAPGADGCEPFAR